MNYETEPKTPPLEDEIEVREKQIENLKRDLARYQEERNQELIKTTEEAIASLEEELKKLRGGKVEHTDISP